MPTTRKRAYDDKQKVKSKRARLSNVAVGEKGIIKNPADNRKQDATTQTDFEVDDDATEVIDPEAEDLGAAVFCLDRKADLIKDLLTPDVSKIQSLMCTIWEHLTKAYERWHHTLKDFSCSDALSTMKDTDYIDDQHCSAHTLSLLENGMFLRIVGEVLEKEVFKKDLLSELRAQAPLEESLKPFEKAAPAIYDILVIAHFREQPYHFEENVIRAYSARFESELGKYDFTFYKHLQEATNVSMQLRICLLLFDEVYTFDYSKDAEVGHPDIDVAPQNWHVILPAVRSRGTTVVKCRGIHFSCGSNSS